MSRHANVSVLSVTLLQRVSSRVCAMARRWPHSPKPVRVSFREAITTPVLPVHTNTLQKIPRTRTLCDIEKVQPSIAVARTYAVERWRRGAKEPCAITAATERSYPLSKVPPSHQEGPKADFSSWVGEVAMFHAEHQG